MHRIPLQLPYPSLLWNRREPESKLFEITLNKRNVEETDEFLTIIDRETEDYLKLAYNKVADQFYEIPKLLNSRDMVKIHKAMQMLNAVVLRSPKDSPVLPTALKLRGNCFFQKCHFEAATMDYEMFLHVGSKTNDAEELFEVNGNLAICYYLRRQYEKAKHCMSAYNVYKGLLTKCSFEKPNLERINRHISHFAKELENIEDIVPQIVKEMKFFTPYKGFNMSENIPLSSVACTYDCNSGVSANTLIPAGNVVLVEHPIVHCVDRPFLLCEVCLSQKEHLYTCLTCRYKTYCSLNCMLKDQNVHQAECIGYKYIILLILDATNLFKIFMRISSLLHKNVFNCKSFRKLTTAADVMEKFNDVDDEIYMNYLQYLRLLSTRPDYSKLSDMQYSTMVMTAFRLTIFIEKKTQIISTFYNSLKLSNKQKMILIGGMLMRLNCHILNESFDFEFLYPLISTKQVQLSMQQQVEQLANDLIPSYVGVEENLLSHYNIDIENDVEKKTIKLLYSHYEHLSSKKIELSTDYTPTCQNTQRHLLTFRDRIAELYFKSDSAELFLKSVSDAYMPTITTPATLLCSRINKLTDLERSKFVKMFARRFHKHFDDYFLQLNAHHDRIEQIITLFCTTLSKFRHSCVPNVEVMVMENGVVIGKTLQDIKSGEELLVSYKMHYMCHTQAERKQFLQNLQYDCNCKYCVTSDMDDVCNQRLGIFCYTCQCEITPALGKCSNCGTCYKDLAERYKLESIFFAHQIQKERKSKGSERDLFISHLIAFNHARKCYVPSNEFRIRIEVEYAYFLALKNFAQKAYEIIVVVKDKLLSYYEERLICFTIYDEILNIIKIILHFNLNENFYSVSDQSLKHLCNFGLCIIRQQLAHIKLYETYDLKCAPILYDLHLFLDWKDQMPCNGFLPFIDRNNEIKDHNGKKKDTSKPPPDLVPIFKQYSKLFKEINRR